MLRYKDLAAGFEFVDLCGHISSIWVVHSQLNLQTGPDKSEVLRPVVYLQGFCSGGQFDFSFVGNLIDAKSVNKVSKLSQGEVAGPNPKYFCPLSRFHPSPPFNCFVFIEARPSFTFVRILD